MNGYNAVARKLDHFGLRTLLRSEGVEKGHDAFVGDQCLGCNAKVNVFVRNGLWADKWTCSCKRVNVFASTKKSAVHEKPDLGPDRKDINETLGRLGLPGRYH